MADPFDTFGAPPQFTDEELEQALGVAPSVPLDPFEPQAPTPTAPDLTDEELASALGYAPLPDAGPATEPQPETPEPNIGIGVGGPKVGFEELAPWEQRFSGDLGDTELARPDPVEAFAADVGPAPVSEAIEGLSEDEQRQFYYEMDPRALVLEQQRQANERADAARSAYTREAEAAKIDLDEQSAIIARRRAEADRKLAEVANAVQAAASEKIDPNGHWSSRSDGQKALSLMSVLFGGYSSLYNGGRNPALERFDDLVKQNIQTQIANIQNGRASRAEQMSVLNQVYQRTGDMEQAAHADYLARMADAKQKALQAYQQYDPRSTRAMQGAMAVREIDAKMAEAEAAAREAAYKRAKEQAEFDLERRYKEAQIRKMAAEEAKLRGEIGGPGGGGASKATKALANTLETKFGFKPKDAARAVVLDPDDPLKGEDGNWTGGFIAPDDDIAGELNRAVSVYSTTAELANRIRDIVKDEGNVIDARFFSTAAGKELKSLSQRLVTEAGKEIIGNALGERELDILQAIGGGDPTKLRANPDSLIAGLDSMLKQNDRALANLLRVKGRYGGPVPSFATRGRGQRRVAATGVTQESIDAIVHGTPEQQIKGIVRLANQAGANPEAKITGSGMGAGVSPKGRIREAEKGIEAIDQAIDQARQKGDLDPEVLGKAEEMKERLRLRVRAEKAGEKGAKAIGQEQVDPARVGGGLVGSESKPPDEAKPVKVGPDLGSTTEPLFEDIR